MASSRRTASGRGKVVASYGRRVARDRAASLLRAHAATTPALDALIERELAALDQTCLALGALVDDRVRAASQPALAPGPSSSEVSDLLLRRLDERSREIAHSVLLLVAACARKSEAARSRATRRP